MCCEISNIIDIIMQCDITRCIICISNKVKYLEKEESYKNSTKQVA